MLAVGAAGLFVLFYSGLPFLFFLLHLSGRRPALHVDWNTVLKGR